MKCKCRRCGYEWESITEDKPKVCPRCKSYRWESEIRKYANMDTKIVALVSAGATRREIEVVLDRPMTEGERLIMNKVMAAKRIGKKQTGQ